jgi:hypothetical protein
MLHGRHEKFKFGAQRAAFVRFMLDSIRATYETYVPKGSEW